MAVLAVIQFQNQAYTVAVFETIWERMSCHDPQKYGDLNNVNLLEDEITSKEQFDNFMGLVL